MLLYILKRFLGMVPIIWGIITLSFLIMRLTPGGPFDQERPIHPKIRAELESAYHLDQPLWKQYLHYLSGICQGNLGPSFKYIDLTVNDIMAMSFPISLELGAYSLIFATLLGILLGMIAALFRNRWPDTLATGIGVLGLSIPSMVLGPILVLLFSLGLGMFPTSGWDTPSSKILPTITLGTAYLAIILRLTRTGLLDTLSQEFIRTARAKGFRETTIMTRHALRAAILPVVSFLGPCIAFVVTGSVVVEHIFNIPGMGRYFIAGALNRDYTVVLGATIVLSALVLVMNLVVDVMYHFLDPRIAFHTKQT